MAIYSLEAQRRIYVWLTVILAACIAVTILFDLLESERRSHSFFYLSESFLFSSFWWLFAPLLFGQIFFARTHQGRTANILLLAFPITIHLLGYPALVWLVSALFYQQAFPYRQTFEYELIRYGFIVLIVYPVSFVLYRLSQDKKAADEPFAVEFDPPEKPVRASALVVSDSNRRTVIETKDILYFSASPPYIYIHHKTKRYLHNETLRSVLGKLDNDVFVRIHKSTIVNISAIRSFKSRHNGDYDVFVSDGAELRLSRNYAAAFKDKFKRSHRDTTA